MATLEERLNDGEEERRILKERIAVMDDATADSIAWLRVLLEAVNTRQSEIDSLKSSIKHADIRIDANKSKMESAITEAKSKDDRIKELEQKLQIRAEEKMNIETRLENANKR